VSCSLIATMQCVGFAVMWTRFVFFGIVRGGAAGTGIHPGGRIRRRAGVRKSSIRRTVGYISLNIWRITDLIKFQAGFVEFYLRVLLVLP
jgi:hypothetical protein